MVVRQTGKILNIIETIYIIYILLTGVSIGIKHYQNWQAKKDVVAKRCYPDSYTQEMIEEDMNYYDGVIVNLVVYDHSQAGENYMSSFSENGVSRHWRDRDSLFVGVYPFVKAL